MSLSIWGELPWNANVVYRAATKHARFKVTRSDARNVPRLISKLDRVYIGIPKTTSLDAQASERSYYSFE